MTANTGESLNHKARIRDLLGKLRNKLKGFAIINMQGQIVGRVVDLSLDKSRRLNVVMSKTEVQTDSPVFLLSSKYIQKVDPSNRSLFVDLTAVEYSRLPVYSARNNEVTGVSGYSTAPSVAQPSNISFGETVAVDETHSPNAQPSASQKPEDEDDESFAEDGDMPEVVEEEIVRLLEERLVVNRSKRKVGEVIVRKEIEIEMVQVPIQREKLIVEQVGAETKTLAEIDLGRGEVTGVELASIPSSDIHPVQESSADNLYRVTGEFLSPRAASNLLDAIALQKQHGCHKVRVELIVENPELQKTYQEMFDRCSIQPENG